MKYSDQICQSLAEAGYTHCFFVAGGNIMHLLDSARKTFVCIPVINEVSATIAAEYFTAAGEGTGAKAFALVTAGPGLTNSLSGIAGAWLESRELLVIGGQVKTEDLKSEGIRQNGIQEIDGVRLAESICKAVRRLDGPISEEEFNSFISLAGQPRKGPVFLEVPIDVQAAPFSEIQVDAPKPAGTPKAKIPKDILDSVLKLLASSMRPILLLGGGLSRAKRTEIVEAVEKLNIPVMTTWNGADLIPSSHPNYWGRPNTWGQRYANILIQQSDLVIAVGTRLGMQQTGFAWEQFAPLAQVVHVDIDQAELKKKNPRKSLTIQMDAFECLTYLSSNFDSRIEIEEWLSFGKQVGGLLPVSEKVNTGNEGFLNPYDFTLSLSSSLPDDANFIPCSSGGAFTVSMQSFAQKGRQVIISNKGLASMGYGTAGAIGASLARPSKLTVLLEGDGGFAQNFQELGTVLAQKLNLKIFVFSNNGYASIRMTQKNYFDGAWVGCDSSTGLGLPDLQALAKAYGIQYLRLPATADLLHTELQRVFAHKDPMLIEVPIDPNQTYFPKISSRLLQNGRMASNPLHLMDPPLDNDLAKVVFRYFPRESWGQ